MYKLSPILLSKEQKLSKKLFMAIEGLQKIANYYGYDIQDISSKYPYCERKGQTLGIIDRRTNLQIASYAKANKKKIEDFFMKFKK